MHFGEVMKQWREQAGLTQAELAKKSRISLRTVQSWEQGSRSPVSPEFFKLVKTLGALADLFAGIKENPHKPRRKKGA